MIIKSLSIKKFLLIAALILAGLLFITLQADSVYAQRSVNDACEGVGLVSGNNGCQNTGDSPQLNTVIETVVNIITFVVGLAAVIMIIIGGFKYITSGGDSGSTAGAKNTILYALVGLIIVALAQVIVRFVLGEVG